MANSCTLICMHHSVLRVIVEAIEEFQASGVKVLVIDSGSHEWEGEGSCTEIAEKPLLNGKKMADWKRAKAEHKSL